MEQFFNSKLMSNSNLILPVFIFDQIEVFLAGLLNTTVIAGWLLGIGDVLIASGGEK